MTWEKLPALAHGHVGCLNCGGAEAVAPMEKVIAVGFGDAHASRDGVEVYREPSADEGSHDCEDCGGTGGAAPGVLCGQCIGGRVEDEGEPVEYWQFADVEKLAAEDPDHDWRVTLYGPLHGEVYQRQGVSEWVLVESNQGFA